MEKRLDFIIDIPNDIREIQSAFKARGFELFLVGGCVRDSFLGLEPKDWDLVTNALPDKIIELLKNENFVTKILETGKAFGVINVITKNDEFEIATMRKDVGIGRRPESVIFTDIQTDILRRDLTINALFYDIETSEIVDLVGGLDDLSQGIIRTVGLAEDRFGEDRLRILRAIRFAARFGSNLDEDIINALKKNSSLEGISSERIRDEFLKGIKTAKSVRRFMRLLREFNLVGQIFLSDLYVNTFVGTTKDPILVLGQMLRKNTSDVLKTTLNSLSYTTDEIKAIIFLSNIKVVHGFDVIQLKKEQKHSGLTKEQIREFARLIGIDGVFIDLFLEFELSVTGGQVMALTGAKPGPELGRMINEIEVVRFLDLAEA